MCSGRRRLCHRTWSTVDATLATIVILFFEQNRLSIAHTHLSALYAHKINTLFWHDIHDAEQFGFAKGQVTPFTIPTPDGETLYAWHVLPIDAYLRNEKALSETGRLQGPVEDFTTTLQFSLLSSTSPPARVVINCEFSLTLNRSNNHTNDDKSTATRVTWPKAGERILIET
jgi:hypothetical protein